MQFKALFERFKHFDSLEEGDPDYEHVSSRIKALITNMHDNKNSGWQKTKKQAGPIKKKDDIENEVMKENQDKK